MAGLTTTNFTLEGHNVISKSHRSTGSILPLLLTPVGCVVFVVTLIILCKVVNYRRLRNARRSYVFSESSGSTSQTTIPTVAVEMQENSPSSHEDTSSSSLDYDSPREGNYNLGRSFEVEAEVHHPPEEIVPFEEEKNVSIDSAKGLEFEPENLNIPLCT